jgi:hypothetical protein
MNYYTKYPKLPSAAKMYLEGPVVFKPESVSADWLQQKGQIKTETHGAFPLASE